MSSTDAPPEGPSGPAERGPQPQEDEPPEPEVDTQHVALLQNLESELGDALVGSELRKNDLWVRVRADSWRRTGEVCRSLGFDYFCFLSGIDWMPHTWPNPKAEGEDEGTVEGDVTGESPAGVEAGDVDTDPGLDVAGELDTEEGPERPDGAGDTGPERPGNTIETGYAGGDTRYQVLARVYSVERKFGVTLKADLDSEEPRVETWSNVYPGADWHERETWEMYGFDFVGHPNLIHLYLPGEFEGFPLRKDFPLLAREVKPWPGLVDPEPMPETPEASEAEE